MKRIIHLLKVFILSFEFLYILLLFAVYYFWPKIFIIVGSSLKTFSDNLLLLLISIHVSSLGATVTLAWKIHAPLPKSNQKLYQWNDYPLLKDIILLSVGYSSLCAFAGVGLLLFVKKLDVLILGLSMPLTFGIQLIVLSCLFLAALDAREILEKDEE
jgi:hypothetical protein